MEHPNIRTLHLDDVPRSLAREVTSLSDLTWHFGPRGEGFFGQDLSKVAVERLGMRLPEFRAASENQEELESAILNRAAEQRSHLLLVLQVHPNPIEGFVCLVPNARVPLVEEVLSRVPIKRR